MLQKNPFNPQFGSIPRLYLDLDEDIKKYAKRAHRSGDNPVYSLFITGLYGSGKTTFMKRLAQELKKQSKTVVIVLHNTSDLFKTMCNQLTSSLPDLKIAGGGEKHNEIYYRYGLDQILASIKKKNLHVVFCIDEITNTPAIRKLAESFNEWSLNDFKASVIMTGQQKEIDSLCSTYNLTFLIRSDRLKLPRLRKSSMAKTYQKVFAFQNSNLAAEMASLTQGYPYAFQLLGDQMYKSLITASDPRQAFEKAKLSFKDLLFKRAYDVIAHGLTKEELRFLSAVTQSSSLSFIIKQLNKRKQVVNGERLKLEKEGLIKQLPGGSLDFALPLFKEFMLIRQNQFK